MGKQYNLCPPRGKTAQYFGGWYLLVSRFILTLLGPMKYRLFRSCLVFTPNAGVKRIWFAILNPKLALFSL